MSSENHQKIYEKISELFNIKFKVQLKGTEIYFTHLYRAKDLINTDIEFYSVTLSNGKKITFFEKEDFLKGLIINVKDEIDLLNNEYRKLEQLEKSSAFIDDYDLYMRHEHIGYCGDKLLKLLKKLRNLQNNTN
ncbi:hypothetical protein JJC03_04430 [Flavobacterium oreochromis]|uniref:hypothetical protein n=1 Tax=Flavobacterium oreochromis TaxID=2906078 RepID=UPI001CE67804|nr:hypothetical protein [Flavobacterium oreochromis]QYS87186.1 hypothetical protein JJC03_04365 [Flavobacterium oreochromis]QYS87198.1 hypothetical protein JJC03_04430 [Flavobacterium oreochromis]